MDSLIIQAVSWTLVHSIWQAAVIALILAMILPAFRRYGYTVSIASLTILVIACGVTFARHHSSATPQIARQPAVTAESIDGSTDGLSPQPINATPNNTASADQPTSTAVLSHDQHRPNFAADGNPGTSSLLTAVLANWQQWLVTCWLIGTSAQLLRMLFSWLRLRRIHRTSAPVSTQPDLARRFGTLGERLGLRSRVTWLLSRSIDVPIVSGVIRPIVVVPTSMITGMTPEQVDAVLLHELAHVRRHDYLVNLFQMLVETLLFFNPGVWWISKQIRVQREYRCDDMASSACADKKEYAWALAALEQIRSSPALAMAADGGKAGSLLDRINRLVSPAKASSRRLSGVNCFLLVVLTTAVIGFVSSWAMAGPPEGESRMNRDQEEIREVIGRFDPEYWSVVDVPSLMNDKQVALSPGKNWLALVRESQLYVIEANTGQVQQQRPLSLASAAVEWSSNENLMISDGAEISLLVKDQFLRVADSMDQNATFNAVTTAFVGYPYKQRDGWGSTRNREGLVSLAGLPAGKHRVVLAPAFPDRNVTEIVMPLPKSETVIQRKLVPPANWVSSNFHFVASSKQIGGETIVNVRIENRTGGPMEISDNDLRLEVPGPNHSSYWGLSPVWRKELKRKAKSITVADGENGEFSFSWRDMLRNGLWYDEQHFPVVKSGPVIPPAPVGQIGLRVWFRNAGVLPINVVHPVTAFVGDPAAAEELGIAAPPNRISKDEETTRDYVMLQLRKFIFGTGKIETHRINMAIDVVSNDGSRIPEVRERLLEALEESHAEKNGGQPRNRILEVIGRMLADDGWLRWSYEYSKRPGAFPQQRAIAQGDFLYAKSPYLETVMKLGRMATRSDIDYYVMAIRNSHHPQTIEFLLDVINNATNAGPFGVAPAGDVFEPGIKDPAKVWVPPANKGAHGKWADNVGGGWGNAKLIAAIGLAELGRSEGVEWLIKRAQASDVDFDLAKKCAQAMHDLTRSSSDGSEPRRIPDDGFADWWAQNKDRFTPNRVYSIGKSVNRFDR